MMIGTRFTDLNYSSGYWEGSITLSIFDLEFPVVLAVSCWDDEVILTCQEDAYKKFSNAIGKITRSIEGAIFEHYSQVAPEIRDRVGPELGAEMAPVIEASRDLADLVRPTDLLVKRPLPNAEHKRIIGLLFDCKWDPNLGLAVRLEDERITAVGEQDIVL